MPHRIVRKLATDQLSGVMSFAIFS